MANTLATKKQADAIKQRMSEIRTELPYAADDARIRVQQLADWKYHLSKRPLPILAAAAVIGYLIIPSKRTAERIVVERSAPPEGPVQPSKKGVVGGIVGTIATLAMRQATAAAATHLTNLLSHRETS